MTLTINFFEKKLKTKLTKFSYCQSDKLYTVEKYDVGCGSLNGEDLAALAEKNAKDFQVIDFYDKINSKNGKDYAVLVFAIK